MEVLVLVVDMEPQDTEVPEHTVVEMVVLNQVEQVVAVEM
jgi:hypothetical protein